MPLCRRSSTAVASAQPKASFAQHTRIAHAAHRLTPPPPPPHADCRFMRRRLQLRSASAESSAQNLRVRGAARRRHWLHVRVLQVHQRDAQAGAAAVEAAGGRGRRRPGAKQHAQACRRREEGEPRVGCTHRHCANPWQKPVHRENSEACLAHDCPQPQQSAAWLRCMD